MTNNQTKDESLARWVAEKAGDLYMHSKYGEPQIHILSPPRSTATISVYLNCKDVAGRLFDWYDATHGSADSDSAFCEDTYKAVMNRAWFDTPAAIEDLAKACGWEWQNES